MNLAEAIKIVEYHQKWRMGADLEMIHPKILTQALNLILEEVKKNIVQSPLNSDEEIKNVLP